MKTMTSKEVIKASLAAGEVTFAGMPITTAVAFLEYRCRRCGVKFNDDPCIADEAVSALDVMTDVKVQDLYAIHKCDGGGRGIADLFGCSIIE